MKQQRNWLRITLIIVALIVAFGVGYFVQRIAGTAFVVQQQTPEQTEIPELYSWTFALCTVGGRCMDIHAECNGTQVLKILSVTEIGGHEEGWEDPRGGNPSVCPNVRASENFAKA